MRIATSLCSLAFSLSMIFATDDPLASHLFAFSGGVWLMNVIDAAADRCGA